MGRLGDTVPVDSETGGRIQSARLAGRRQHCAIYPSTPPRPAPPVPSESLGLLLLSGSHERAHYAFVLASGAAALGRSVVLFATNRGCLGLAQDWSALDDTPRDARIQAAGVAGLDELRQASIELGVRLIACEAGLRAEGIDPASLLPEVEIAGVATFLAAVGGGQDYFFIEIRHTANEAPASPCFTARYPAAADRPGPVDGVGQVSVRRGNPLSPYRVDQASHGFPLAFPGNRHFWGPTPRPSRHRGGPWRPHPADGTPRRDCCRPWRSPGSSAISPENISAIDLHRGGRFVRKTDAATKIRAGEIGAKCDRLWCNR